MKAQIPWLRVFVEGVVIVGSILLASGLDEWRDEVKEREQAVNHLMALRGELMTTRAELVQDQEEAGEAFYVKIRWVRQSCPNHPTRHRPDLAPLRPRVGSSGGLAFLQEVRSRHVFGLPRSTDLALPSPETRLSALAICRMTPEIEPGL